MDVGLTLLEVEELGDRLADAGHHGVLVAFHAVQAGLRHEH